jgi:hypothetical protein
MQAGSLRQQKKLQRKPKTAKNMAVRVTTDTITCVLASMPGFSGGSAS